MFILLRQRNFALLWFAGLISLMGDWMLLVGLPIYTFTLTHSIAATSATFLADQIPQILLGSVAGVFVDRWDRKRVLIITNFLLGLGLVPLIFVHEASQLWVVYGVAIIESMLSQFLTAESVLLPRLVGKEQLVAANGLNSFSSSIARLIGPTLGGFVAVLFSLSGIALLDALTFFIAVLLLIFLVVPEEVRHQRTSDENAKPARFTIWQDWLEGLHIIRRERVIKGFFLVMSIAAFADGLFVVLYAPFVKTILQGNAADIGYLTSAQALGGLIGGLLVPHVTKKLSPAHLITCTGVLLGLNHFFLFNYPAFLPGTGPAICFFCLGGIATSGFFVQLTTLLQTNTSDAYRGRIFGMYGVTWALFLLLGTSLTGIVGDRVNILFLLNIEAGLFLPASIIAWIFLRPRAALALTTQVDQPQHKPV